MLGIQQILCNCCSVCVSPFSFFFFLSAFFPTKTDSFPDQSLNFDQLLFFDPFLENSNKPGTIKIGETIKNWIFVGNIWKLMDVMSEM